MYDSFPYAISRIGNSRQTENGLVVPRGWGWEGMGTDCFTGYMGTFRDDGHVLEPERADDYATAVGELNATGPHTLQWLKW